MTDHTNNEAAKAVLQTAAHETNRADYTMKAGTASFAQIGSKDLHPSVVQALAAHLNESAHAMGGTIGKGLAAGALASATGNVGLGALVSLAVVSYDVLSGGAPLVGAKPKSPKGTNLS